MINIIIKLIENCISYSNTDKSVPIQTALTNQYRLVHPILLRNPPYGRIVYNRRRSCVHANRCVRVCVAAALREAAGGAGQAAGAGGAGGAGRAVPAAGRARRAAARAARARARHRPRHGEDRGAGARLSAAAPATPPHRHTDTPTHRHTAAHATHATPASQHSRRPGRFILRNEYFICNRGFLFL